MIRVDGAHAHARPRQQAHARRQVVRLHEYYIHNIM